MARVCSVSSDKLQKLIIDHRPHTIRHMLLMRSVDSYTFLAVAVMAASFLTWAMILILKFFSLKGGSKLLTAGAALPGSFLYGTVPLPLFCEVVFNNP